MSGARAGSGPSPRLNPRSVEAGRVLLDVQGPADQVGATGAVGVPTPQFAQTTHSPDASERSD